MPQMLSPVTGKLTLYVKTETIGTCEPFDADLQPYVDALQQELTIQGHDVIIESVRNLQTPMFSHVLIEAWIPEETMSLGQEKLLAPAIIAALLLLAKVLIVTAIPIAIILAGAWTLRYYIFPPKPDPFSDRLYYATDGTGPYTLTELVAYQQATHPGEYVCHYCGQVFPTVEERDTHEKECPWRGLVEGDGEAWPWWATALIIGAVAVAAILIIPRVLDLLPKGKKD